MRPSEVFRPLDDALPLFFKLLKLVSFSMLILVIINVVLSSVYGYLYGNIEHLKEGTWEYCLGAVGTSTSSSTSTTFLKAVASQCVQTIIFSTLTLTTIFRAFNHEEWLPSSISFVVYTLFGAICYFPTYPIIPYPSQMTASIVSLTSFIHPAMYLNNTVCDHAYRLNAFFLSVQYITAFFMLALFLLAVVAEIVRQLSPKPDHGPQLTGIKFPLMIAYISFFSFFIGLIARGHACIITLSLANINSPAYPTYPFTSASLEASTIFLVVSTMSVFRGNTLHSASAFRLSFVCAVMYVILLYPTIVNGFKMFDLNKLWDHDNCRDFFMETTFYSPQDYQANQLCTDTRVIFVSQLISFFLMHFQSVFCGYVFFKNRHQFKTPISISSNQEFKNRISNVSNNYTLLGADDKQRDEFDEER